jgi:hypothetical protein
MTISTEPAPASAMRGVRDRPGACGEASAACADGSGRIDIPMNASNHLRCAIVAVLLLLAGPFHVNGGAEGKTAAAKSLRCTFPLSVTASWKKTGVPDASVAPATLVLVFDSINTDEGTARLRSGSVGSEIVARLASGYLHFIQSFRTGPLYTTTVFDQETSGGRLRAVHSRHESFSVPLPGATSSPEQYYGECEVLN